MAIFNSKLLNYQRVNIYYLLPSTVVSGSLTQDRPVLWIFRLDWLLTWANHERNHWGRGPKEKTYVSIMYHNVSICRYQNHAYILYIYSNSHKNITYIYIYICNFIYIYRNTHIMTIKNILKCLKYFTVLYVAPKQTAYVPTYSWA